MTDPQRNDEDVPMWRDLVPVVVYLTLLIIFMIIMG